MSVMLKILWDMEKEKRLQAETSRNGVTFADCTVAIADGRILDVLAHPKRPNQQIMVLNIDGYAYAVPFVTGEDGSWFLKTVFPSRKYTALYLKKRTS